MTYKKHETKSQKDYSWIWGIVGIIAFLFFAKSCDSGSGASGPRFPFDNQYSEDSDMAQEYWEGKQEAELLKDDPCLQDILNGVPKEYQRCGNNNQSSSSLTSSGSSSQTTGSSTLMTVKGWTSEKCDYAKT